MSKHTFHAEELAEEIRKALYDNDLLKTDGNTSKAVIDTLLNSIKDAGFPGRND